MKLFQIEEPDGSPLAGDGPGVAVGIELSAAKGAAVAVAVGGNAEMLSGADGSARLAGAEPAAVLLLALRERAEKALARPVTHAVIVLDGAEVDDKKQEIVAQAAAAMLFPSSRGQIVNDLLVAWQQEVEPAQRTALATVIGSIALDSSDGQT